MDLEKLKYPVGQFKFPDQISQEEVSLWAKTIADFPKKFTDEVNGLNDEQLHWKYRPEGWNILQVVHHCADSHMNAFIRFKLTLTEDSPEVKPYLEQLWSELPDTIEAPIAWSLDILSGLHQRWSLTIDGLSKSDLLKAYHHSEYKKTYQLQQVMALYAWHCDHHLEHVRQAKASGGTYN